MWVLFAFLSAIFAGLTAVLAKIGLKDADSNLVTALRTVVVMAFSLFLICGTGAIWAIGEIKLSTFCFLILSGLSTGVSWICYFKALQMGDINKVVPIDKSSTVLSMLLGILLLGETDNLAVKLIGMALIAVGTGLMLSRTKGVEPAPKQAEEASPKGLKSSCLGSWWFYAVLSAVFAALTSILGKIGMEAVDSNLGTAIRTAVVLAVAWLIVFKQGKQKEIKMLQPKSWLFILLSGMATGGSWLCYYRALQDGPASVVVPIDKLSILITVCFGVLLFKEKMSKNAWFGLGLLTLGTLVLLIQL